jgi:hypothetical protein
LRRATRPDYGPFRPLVANLRFHEFFLAHLGAGLVAYGVAQCFGPCLGLGALVFMLCFISL